MDFLIKQNSTLPILTMKVIENNDFNGEDFKNMFNNATVTFSMIDADSGKYIIANKAGGIIKVPNKTVGCGDNDDIIIFYEWLEKNTKNAGVFIGEFTINFFDNEGNDNGILKVPIKERLYIHIQESFSKTSLNGF